MLFGARLLLVCGLAHASGSRMLRLRCHLARSELWMLNLARLLARLLHGGVLLEPRSLLHSAC